jgi:alcohol dehydrogenase, propanol-preferring
LGAHWTGDVDDEPPALLDRAIDTTPAWRPVLRALERLRPAGRLVINAIRKEPNDQEVLLQTDFARHLWMEKEVKSVANVTRKDAEECLALAEKAGIRPVVQEYALDEANEALADLRSGRIRGSKVLVMPE